MKGRQGILISLSLSLSLPLPPSPTPFYHPHLAHVSSHVPLIFGQILLESSVWDVPQLYSAVLRARGDLVIIEGVPGNVHDQGLVTAHLWVVDIKPTNLCVCVCVRVCVCVCVETWGMKCSYITPTYKTGHQKAGQTDQFDKNS